MTVTIITYRIEYIPTLNRISTTMAAGVGGFFSPLTSFHFVGATFERF